MAEESWGLVPEVYYDVIARVCAGAPLLGLAVYEYDRRNARLDLSSVAIVFIFVFGSYLIGHVLGTVSAIWNVLLWRRWLIKLVMHWMPTTEGGLHTDLRKSLRPGFHELYRRIDRIAKKDNNGGTILKKMEAGAALSDNLFSGFIVFLGLRAGGFVMFVSFRDTTQVIGTVLVGVTLLSSVLLRRAVLIGRQDSLWDLHFGGQKVKSQGTSRGHK
jgi:hypothetical protein